MKLSRLSYKGVALSLLIFSIFTVSVVSYRTLGQTKQTEIPKDDGSASWRPSKIAINSLNSNFDLTLPELNADTDWIVGVTPVKEGEAEEMVIGIVSWEDSGMSKKLNIERISNIANYPADLLENSRGKFTIKNSADAVQASNSMVVFLKVAPGTKVNIGKSTGSLASRTVDSGFVLQNNLTTPLKASGVHVLLTQLQTARLAKNFKRKPEVKNE